MGRYVDTWCQRILIATMFGSVQDAIGGRASRSGSSGALNYNDQISSTSSVNLGFGTTNRDNLVVNAVFLV